MEAYRDQYATLFNGGKGVTLIGISVDSDTALVSWAKDARFPFIFASDGDGAVGTKYGAYNPENKVDNRSLYVIGPDGRIAYKAQPFRQSSADAYTELEAEIDKLSPPGAGRP
ncbi:MAG: peroxiredoxin family protein [Gemmatimonadetes bacterium]|nr:peroxiredoxin family protein [Gemmatimonadota bacterium]MCC6770469.1 peroxiredoxin family protein [Gemmatimonadaceae bacterium]